jgi:hypothetical protein
LFGDLLELAGEDQARFRKFLFETVWALLTRGIAGFLLAATVGGGVLVSLQSTFFTLATLHSANHSQRAWGSTLAFLAGCLLVMACFSVVRYGVRDRMTWLAFAYIAPLAAAGLLWWVPGVPATSEALLLVISLGSLLWPSSRSAILALALLVVLQSGLWFGAIGSLLKPLAALWRHVPANAIALKPLVSTVFAVSYAALVMLTCVVYAKVRRWVYA